jgi:hypothetical protein
MKIRKAGYKSRTLVYILGFARDVIAAMLANR